MISYITLVYDNDNDVSNSSPGDEELAIDQINEVYDSMKTLIENKYKEEARTYYHYSHPTT